MANLPFKFVEIEWARKYVSLQNTLKKYMGASLRKVEEKLANILPTSFGIVIDGWTDGGTHFLAIYASFVDTLSEQVKQYLLACSPMGDETLSPLWNLLRIHCQYTKNP